MSDFAVTIRVRNARILRRMRECGIASQAELARRAGVSMTTLNAVVALRKKPTGYNGEFTDSIRNVAAVLECDAEDLFSEAQRDMALERNAVEIEVDENRVRALTSGEDTEQAAWAKIEAQRLLGVLPDRERYVIEQRMDGATLEEVAGAMGLSKGRVGQIEIRGLHRMKEAVRHSDSSLNTRFLVEDHPLPIKLKLPPPEPKVIDIEPPVRILPRKKSTVTITPPGIAPAEVEDAMARARAAIARSREAIALKGNSDGE